MSEEKAAPRRISPAREQRRFFQDDSLRLPETRHKENQLVAPVIRRYHAVHASSPDNPSSTLKAQETTVLRRPLITYGKNRQTQLLGHKDVYDGEQDASLSMILPSWKSQAKPSRTQHTEISASPACPESDDIPPNCCKDDFQRTESQECRTMEELIQVAHNVSNPDANIGLKRSTVVPDHEDAAWELTRFDAEERAPEQKSFSSNR